jgi:cystathionine gamma-synthase
MISKSRPGPSTRCVHLGRRVDPATRAVVRPIYLNSGYAYDDCASWKDVALGNKPGYIYSRNTNPTTDLFEQKIAALEGAEAATSFATGMAAISTSLLALLAPGKRVVSVKDSYGGTNLFFTKYLPKFGVRCDLFDTTDHDALESAIGEGCDLVYLETPTNPTVKIVDLARLISAAQRVGATVMVDNTFATPINQNPIRLGADLVLHSATKFLCGHSDAMGGVVCGRKDLIEEIFRYREIAGPSLDPNSAFLLLRSLKTLALRIERQNANAMLAARFLQTHKRVARVLYPGLETHPGHDIARRQMHGGFGGMLSFELEGGLPAVERFLPRLKLAYLAANLGQVETIAGPPALTSHVECTPEERAAAGIPEGLIRYSVGIEDAADLIDDLRTAMGAL